MPKEISGTGRSIKSSSGRTGGISLNAYVQRFPTPDVRGFTNKGSLELLSNIAGSKEEFMGMAYRTGRKKKETIWATPTANDAKNSLTGSQRGRGTLTAHIVESLWPTPQYRDFKSGQASRAGRHGKQNNLNDVVQRWPTPRNNAGPSKDKKHLSLDGAVQLWPTPGTTGLSNGSGNCKTINKIYDAGRITDDERRSMRSGNGGQLNPDWVEALMGYPKGWTDIEKEASFKSNFPRAWFDGTWEEGIPRTVTGVENRVSRLKCLGNAVVPQIPAFIWALVKKRI